MPGQDHRPPRRPNIVYILADDLGWADLGCTGSRFHQSPHLDRLATQGVRFETCYAAAPVCSATRSSIQTGRYPARLHLTDFIPGHRRPWARLRVPDYRQQLPLEEISLARALKPAGYTCANIGKWHLGGPGFGPAEHGFDHVFSTGVNDDDKQVSALTEDALGFIRAHRHEPFLLMLCHYTVHIPLEAKRALTGKYAALAEPGAPQSNPTYAAMIEVLDDSVGRVLAELDALGLADDTIVLFGSDNGGLVHWYIGDGPEVTSNAPCRGEKGTIHEGGLRVPLIVRWPGHTQVRRVCDVPVSTIDLFPTLMEAAGVPVTHSVDGLSLMPLLTGSGGIGRDTHYFHYPHYHNDTPAGAIRRGDMKLIEFFEDSHVELYDLAEDVGEAHDLAPARPDVAEELRRELAEWRLSVDAQMPTVNPEHDPRRAHEWESYPPPWWE